MSAQPKKSAGGAGSAGAGAGKQQQQQQSGGKTPTTPQPQSSPSAAAVAAASSPASAAATAAGGVFVPLLPPPSQLLPGATLRIRTSLNPAAFDAVLFVFDAAAGLMVVERARGTGDWEDAQADNEREQGPIGEGKKDYAILSTKQVRVELLSAPSAKPKPLPPLSQELIAGKVQEAMQLRMEEKNSLGVGVTPEGQKLFDAIRKTTPCVWDDKSFIVMKSVRVSPPYTVDACVTIAPPAPQSPPQQRRNPSSAAAQAAAAEAMLTRVRKIVDAERTKLKLTNTQ